MVQATLCKMGNQLPSPKRGQNSPQFSDFRPIFIVAKRLDAIGMEVRLSAGDFVLDADPASPLLIRRGEAG